MELPMNLSATKIAYNSLQKKKIKKNSDTLVTTHDCNIAS